MKFELSDRDQRRLESAMKNNPIRRFLLHKDNFNFEIGDVLVKKSSRWNHETKEYDLWQAEPISSSNKMAQRYVCVHKDEFGIPYLKQLKVSTGKLGLDIYCASDYDYNNTRFEVDPEYAEKIFLDADFDIKQIHNASLESRKIATKMNRKVGFKPKTLKDHNDFFATLKVGDQFWVASDFTAQYVSQYTISKIETIPVSTLDQNYDWAWRSFKDRFKESGTGNIKLDDVVGTRLHVKEGNSSVRVIYAFDFRKHGVFFKAPPAQEEKK